MMMIDMKLRYAYDRISKLSGLLLSLLVQKQNEGSIIDTSESTMYTYVVYLCDKSLGNTCDHNKVEATAFLRFS